MDHILKKGVISAVVTHCIHSIKYNGFLESAKQDDQTTDTEDR
jgi:hypothetical protein